MRYASSCLVAGTTSNCLDVDDCFACGQLAKTESPCCALCYAPENVVTPAISSIVVLMHLSSF